MAIVTWHIAGELEDAIRLASDRFQYVVVSMTLPDDLRELVEWHRVPFLPYPSFRLRWALFFALAGARVRRLRADLVHTIGPTPVIPNRVDANTAIFCHAAYHEATRGAGIKGTSVGWRAGQHVARMLERWWFSRRVRLLVALSNGAADELRRHYPHVPRAVVPLGIDLERFQPAAAVREEVRRQHSVGPEDVVALFVDQDHRPLKGLDRALHAFASATRTGGGPQLLWVLGHEHRGPVSLARRLGIGDRVAFLGYREDPERFYQAADIFLLASAYETFSRAAHEAAACGLPVVGPRVNGVDELIGEGEAGLVVRRDPLELAGALSTLASDPALRHRLGAAGLARMAAFDRAAVAARIVELHERLYESGGSVRL